MGEFAYAYFGDLKDDALKKIPWEVFGLFVYVFVFSSGHRN